MRGVKGLQGLDDEAGEPTPFLPRGPSLGLGRRRKRNDARRSERCGADLLGRAAQALRHVVRRCGELVQQFEECAHAGWQIAVAQCRESRE